MPMAISGPMSNCSHAAQLRRTFQSIAAIAGSLASPEARGKRLEATLVLNRKLKDGDNSLPAASHRSLSTIKPCFKSFTLSAADPAGALWLILRYTAATVYIKCNRNGEISSKKVFSPPGSAKSFGTISNAACKTAAVSVDSCSQVLWCKGVRWPLEDDHEFSSNSIALR